MARLPRFQFPGAYYHIMSRGDRKEIIYHDDEDRRVFQRCLAKACQKTGWGIHAYVLMPNHYHMLLETPEANLAVGMKWLQGVYTQNFNKSHDTCGHVFQGRYKSLVIDPLDSHHIIAVSDYIHLNPIRAGIVGDLNGLISYQWSSLPAYLSPTQNQPIWLVTSRIFRDLGWKEVDQPAQKAYYDRIATLVRQLDSQESAALLHEQWRDIRRGWFLGDKHLKKQLIMNNATPTIEYDLDHGSVRKEKGKIDADNLIQLCLMLLDLDSDELPRLKKTDYRKQLIAWVVRKYTCASNAWLSKKLHMGHPVNVSNAVRIVENADSHPFISLRNSIEKGVRS
jgi:putative transposase